MFALICEISIFLNDMKAEKVLFRERTSGRRDRGKTG
jgi:hypothetical protein